MPNAIAWTSFPNRGADASRRSASRGHVDAGRWTLSNGVTSRQVEKPQVLVGWRSVFERCVYKEGDPMRNIKVPSAALADSLNGTPLGQFPKNFASISSFPIVTSRKGCTSASTFRLSLPGLRRHAKPLGICDRWRDSHRPRSYLRSTNVDHSFPIADRLDCCSHRWGGGAVLAGR